MNPSSTSDAPSSKPAESPAELEERLRLLREERVRKSLARLERDRFSFTTATGAATLMKVIGIVVTLLALWAAWARWS